MEDMSLAQYPPNPEREESPQLRMPQNQRPVLCSVCKGRFCIPDGDLKCCAPCKKEQEQLLVAKKQTLEEGGANDKWPPLPDLVDN